MTVREGAGLRRRGVGSAWAPVSDCCFLRLLPQPVCHAVYWSPKNLRTRADLRARTRKNGSENTTWEMLPYRS